MAWGQAINLEIVPQKNPPRVRATQYDDGGGWQITFNLFQDGEPVEIGSGEIVTIEGTTPGGTGFSVNANALSGSNSVIVSVTNDMTAYKGSVWCKLVVRDGEAVKSTSGFWLDCDRAGVDAETVISAPGFEEQISNAVNAWLDEHPPASSGMTEAFKQALLDCFENVAWINDQGQTYYDALYNALNPEPTPPIPDLPSGYTKYDYVSCDGNAYFQIQNTSNPPVPLGCTVHAIAQQTTHSASASKVAAGGGSDNAYIGYAAYGKTAGKAGSYYGASYTAFADFANLLTSKTDFVTKITAESVTTTTINSGVSKTVTTPVESTPTQNSTSIKIGYSGASGSNFVGKIYLVEVKNTSDELTHQFVPCKRDSDSVAGMYDTVTSTFYASSGSSQFTAGND